jgi:hypothetical protein
VHGQGGQATVEWVALVLLAALVLTGAAALASSERDAGLAVLRTSVTFAANSAANVTLAERAPAGAAAAPPARPRAPAPRAPRPRAVDAFRRLRGVAQVARGAWIACLGYKRWRYELEHPSAPGEALPIGEALAIANACLNPHDYLFED